MLNKIILSTTLVLLYSILPYDSSCQILDKFFDETVDASFTKPVGITFDENGRGYVWEQGGKVFILDTEGNKIPTPLIDLSEEIVTYGDHGLLGFALHPNFLENGYYYLAYIVDRHHLFNFGTPDYNPDVDLPNEASIGRVTRYQADPSNDFKTTLLDSRKILLGETPDTGIPVLMISHGIGGLVFGNDGSLLLSVGEGGSFQTADIGSAVETYFEQALDDGILKEKENIGSFRSQLIDCLLGKILRLDPETGDGLPSNPFYEADRPRSAKSRVWALGFRNPYRFIVKAGTGAHNMSTGNPGHLFIGDVGANLWEEINAVRSGGQNMGWPLYESYFRKWPYHWEYLENTDAKNPFYGQNECVDPYFTYNDLLKDPKENDPVVFENPCKPDDTVPEDIPTFIHHRPIIAWSNVDWNPPARTFTPSFDENGEASAMRIDSTDSTVEGENFEGYSSIPGFFYEGDQYPEEFHGNLIQADYRGWIRALKLDEDYQVVAEKAIHTDCKGITHLTFNPHDQMMYYTNIVDQKIHKVGYSGTPPPVVQLDLDQQYGNSPMTVEFSAENSYSPYEAPLSYFWEFGDGSTSVEMNPSHTFASPTSAPTPFLTKLTVTDTAQVSRTKEVLITLNNTPPIVEITSFDDGDFYPVNGITNLPLIAEVTDAEHDNDELMYEWTTFLHHNSHFHPEPSLTTSTGTALLEPLGCQEETFYYRIKLKVTDGAGLSSTDEKKIYPFCGEPFVDFIQLEGETLNKNVILNWDTNTDAAAVSFEIQKKRLALQFDAIGTVDAQTSNSYSFTDDEGIFGLNTYRIKAYNAEGTYIYSNEIMVDLALNEAFSIYPNPTSSLINISIKETTDDFIYFNLFDALGRKVNEKVWASTLGEQFQQQLSVNNMNVDIHAGVYVYEVINGDQVFKGKIVIQ